MLKVDGARFGGCFVHDNRVGRIDIGHDRKLGLRGVRGYMI